MSNRLLTRNSTAYQYHQNQQTVRMVCLNPNCDANKRVRDYQAGENFLDSVEYDHLYCGGWIFSKNELQRGLLDHAEIELDSLLGTDYFQYPIESIYYIEKFSSMKWEEHLKRHFERIKTSINFELERVEQRCLKSIQNHLNQNKNVYNNLQHFCKVTAVKWSDKHQQQYENHLKHDLLDLQKIGCLQICSQISENKLSDIIDQIKNIQPYIWNKEVKYDLLERKTLRKQRRDLIYFTEYANLQQTNCKLQEISSLLKSTIKYIDKAEFSQVNCLVCEKIITSKDNNPKQRKKLCRLKLLDHMCRAHTNYILQKMPKNISLRMSISQIKDEIYMKNTKKVIIVDKQNINKFNCGFLPQASDVYYIEIVSKINEHLARSRYLVAQSKGKDAADILIIMTLCELSKLKLQQIILLTNDHFGDTLQPIFANLGLRIKIQSKLDPSDYYGINSRK